MLALDVVIIHSSAHNADSKSIFFPFVSSIHSCAARSNRTIRRFIVLYVFIVYLRRRKNGNCITFALIANYLFWWSVFGLFLFFPIRIIYNSIVDTFEDPTQKKKFQLFPFLHMNWSEQTYPVYNRIFLSFYFQTVIFMMFFMANRLSKIIFWDLYWADPNEIFIFISFEMCVYFVWGKRVPLFSSLLLLSLLLLWVCFYFFSLKCILI